MSSTLNILSHEGSSQPFAEGQVIFKQGDPGEVMYFVVEGEVEISLGDRVLNNVVQGGIFGEMALIDDAPRSATAVAKTECRLIPISQRRFVFLVQSMPYFALQVMSVMAERLRHSLANSAP